MLFDIKENSSNCIRFLFCVLVIAFSDNAFSDVKLLDSFPKSGAKVSESVTDVRLWFDVTPDPTASKIDLLQDGKRIPVLALHGMGENDLMGLIQQPTPPGPYRLVWRVAAVGSDTLVDGELYFTILNNKPEP